jgi:hypothetical protein
MRTVMAAASIPGARHLVALLCVAMALLLSLIAQPWVPEAFLLKTTEFSTAVMGRISPLPF